MGQARRRRQQQRAEEGTNSLPFVTNSQAARELGRDGLRDLAAHLWPKDCQTCGWELGTEPPALVVQDFMVFMAAGLHHQRCRAPSWRDNTTLTSQALLSYDVTAFEVPFRRGEKDPTVDLRPFFLVNPSLEQVMISETADGWRVNTVEMWQRAGLHTPGPGFVIDKPVPDFTADLVDGTLSVTVDTVGQRWELPVNAGFQRAVRTLGGVTLAVSTAAVPSQLDAGQVAALLLSGEAALGWVALAGATPTPTSVAAPASLRTFALHRGPHRASVGELLASTTESLTGTEAQNWAATHLPVDHQTLAPWEPDDDEPGAWIAFHALQAIHYYLRRAGAGWELVKGIARGPSNLGDLQQWATRAVRVRGGGRILDWVSRPTNNPDYATFHGSAVPQ